MRAEGAHISLKKQRPWYFQTGIIFCDELYERKEIEFELTENEVRYLTLYLDLGEQPPSFVIFLSPGLETGLALLLLSPGLLLGLALLFGLGTNENAYGVGTAPEVLPVELEVEVVGRGEAEGLRRVAEALAEQETDSAQYQVARAYLQTLENLAANTKGDKTVFLPYEAAGVLSSIGSVKELLSSVGEGSGTGGASPPPLPPAS